MALDFVYVGDDSEGSAIAGPLTPLKITKIGSDYYQPVLLVDSSGTPVTPTGSMVTLTHTRPPCLTGVSTTILAANPNRKPGGWVQNNSGSDFWLEIGAAAVVGQGIRLYGNGGLFYINTTQEITAIQASGGTLSPDNYEAT